MVRTGESADSLKSWLLERLACYIWQESDLRRPRALAPMPANRSAFRRTALLHSLRHGHPCGRVRTVHCRLPTQRDRPTYRFFREILVATAGVCKLSSLQGRSTIRHGSHALHPEQLNSTPGRRSVQAIHCVQNSLGHSENPPEVLAFPGEDLQEAVGPSPLPGRWPSDPYRPVTGLRKSSPRSCPAGCASALRHLGSRRTFAALLPHTRRYARTLMT